MPKFARHAAAAAALSIALFGAACSSSVQASGSAASTVLEQPAQHPRPEAHCIDRDALVHPVEEGGEVEVGWQPQRGETIAGDAPGLLT